MAADPIAAAPMAALPLSDEGVFFVILYQWCSA